MTKEEFIEALNKLQIEVDSIKLEQLDTYFKMLISYNKLVNLTAITEEKQVYLKHFYDSLTLIKSIDLTKPLKVCDVGTGAGFPGIVLKIFFPTLSITLVDSLEKRVKFLNEVIAKLDLKNIEAIHTRIEDFKEKESFDLVVSRAVAKTSVILELVSPLPKVSGYVILMKGNITSEIKEAKSAIDKLNYKLDNIINFKLPIENSERNLVVLKKIDHTNAKYPRPYAKIKVNNL